MTTNPRANITDLESSFVYRLNRKLFSVKIQTMGQSTSACKEFLPDTVDAVQFQITKHSKILSELNELTFEQFQESLEELNEL
jgi:hypothetical protein